MNQKNKKGFTLIELLAVIVILAIIALIAVPIVLNMIEDARKSAAVDSTYGYIKAVEYEIGLDELKNKNRFKDGKEDVENLDINVKGTKPTYGEIEIKNKNIIYANMCINGYMVTYENEKAKAFDRCTGSYDKTGPEIILGQVSGTTNSLTIPFEVVDNESEIKEIKCYYGIDKKYEKEGKIENNKCVITGLKNNTTYNYKIEATNAGGIKSTKEGSETTRNFEGLEIKVDTADWAQSKEITIIGSTEGSKLQYQINEHEEDNWIDIEDGHTFTLKENGTIYARLYDGTNSSEEVEMTILNIDTTAPENITTSSVDNNATSIKINYTGGTDSESGTTKYICHYGTSESLGTTKELLSTDTSCEVTTNTGTKYYYKICAINNAGLETCSSVGNITTWVGIPSDTYTTGDEITYGGKTWLVVKDNGSTTTLISKSNIATGAYTSASTSINSYISNNATFNLDKSLSALTGEGLPTRTAMPANSSGTPFWTSTAGGAGYYILGSSGATTYTKYTYNTAKIDTRYYATGIGSYSSKQLYIDSTDIASTATAMSAASSATKISLTNDTKNTNTDTIYTSSETQTGTKTYKNTNGKVRAAYRLATSVNGIRAGTSSTYYGTEYQDYGSYLTDSLTTKTIASTVTSPVSMSYCDQNGTTDSSGNKTGIKTVSTTLSSTSASFSVTLDDATYSLPNGTCLQVAGNSGAYDAAGVTSPGYTDYSKYDYCSTKKKCYNARCSTQALAKETLLYFFNYYYGTTQSNSNTGVDVTATNWTTGSYSYKTTNTTDCAKKTYYTISTSADKTIGIRTVITVKER